MSKKTAISRRTLLRGLGASLALPWMESMAAATADQMPPRRIAFMFVPNGVHVPDWTPTTEGFRYDLPYILEPLAKVRDDVMVISGLTHDKGRANGDGAGDHARSASVLRSKVTSLATSCDRAFFPEGLGPIITPRQITSSRSRPVLSPM